MDDRKLPLLGRVRTRIASLPDRENVVWELWAGNDNIADVCCEGGEPSVEIFPARGRELRVSLDQFMAALAAARDDFATT